MGLFGKKEPTHCTICGEETGTPTSKKHITRDKDIICNDCFLAAGFPAKGYAGATPTCVIKDQLTKDDGVSLTERMQAYCDREIETQNKINQIAMDEMRAKTEAVRAKTADDRAARASAPVKCPRCGSTQISADKKGFGIGKAVVGAAIAGPIGLVGGNIGAKKVRITCLKCGNQWMAGNG